MTVEFISKLSIPSMLYPPDDPRPPAFIFLDIDGVMTGRPPNESPGFSQAYSAAKRELGGAKADSYVSDVAAGQHLDREALSHLQRMIACIEKINMRCLVVISSNWRTKRTVKTLRDAVFNTTCFAKYICGKTPKIGGGERGDEIQAWLNRHAPPDPNFVVLDDCKFDLKRFGERFIHIASESKYLRLFHIARAMEALSPKELHTLSSHCHDCIQTEFTDKPAFIFWALPEIEVNRSESNKLRLDFEKDSIDNLCALIQKIETAGKRPLIVLAGEWRKRASLQQMIIYWHTAQFVIQESQYYKFVCGQTDSILLELFGVFKWLMEHNLDKSTANYVYISTGTDWSKKKESFGDRYICLSSQSFTRYSRELAEKQLGLL